MTSRHFRQRGIQGTKAISEILFSSLSFGGAFLGCLVAGNNGSGSSKLIASSQLMTPAIKSASFLMFPGEGPGNSLISWTSVAPISGLTIVEMSDWLGLDHRVHFCGPDEKAWFLKEMLGRWKEKKEWKRKAGSEGSKGERNRYDYHKLKKVSDLGDLHLTSAVLNSRWVYQGLFSSPFCTSSLTYVRFFFF